MQVHDDGTPVSEQAARALDLALVGRDLQVGPTARQKLIEFTTRTVEARGFQSAYLTLGGLLDRSELRASVEVDNAKDAQQRPAREQSNRTLSQLFAAAKAGDTNALQDLNAKAANVR